MATSRSIPVVDFQQLSPWPGEDVSLADSPTIQELHAAFSTVGFVFLTNHGIGRELIDSAFEVARTFFTRPLTEKEKYSRIDSSDNTGYVCLERESVDPSKPGDLKECYNITPIRSERLPDAEVPRFRAVVTELYEACMRLSLAILEAMGQALKLKDPHYFAKAHAAMGEGDKHNFTTMRLLHYPPLPPDSQIKPGQLRCGEHVDYGSITLLFQDPSGGLQVKQADGGYIDVPYMPEAVLVNLGALMQQWTADVYLATPHRVLIPMEEAKKRVVRQSLAFFVHPDNEVLVECVDGSNKYPPITAVEDTTRRLDRTY